MLQQQQSTKSCASWYAVCLTTFVLVGCRSLCWLCLYLFVCCSHLWRRWWHTRPIYATSPCVPTDSPTWLRSACLGIFQWPFYWIIVCWHIVFADIVCWHSMRSRVCVIIACLSVCLSVCPICRLLQLHCWQEISIDMGRQQVLSSYGTATAWRTAADASSVTFATAIEGWIQGWTQSCLNTVFCLVNTVISSGVLGGIRGYTLYTNLRVFLTAYTHLSDHK